MTKKFSIKKLVAGVMAAAMVVTALPVSGLTVKAAGEDTGDAVLCAYNPNNGEHLFTVDKAEYDANVSRGYVGEGAKWTAASTGTPLTRVYNPNSGEHLLLPEAEVASVVAAGWSNEGVKMYSDDNKGVPVYRLFNPNETRAGSHHYTPNKEEAATLAAAGWTWEYNQQPVFYGVGEDLSGEITLQDRNGLQTNGTALPSDTLEIIYGSSLGTPKTVVWYCNGAVKNAVTLDSGRIANAFDSDACRVGEKLADGEWQVTIENTSGKMFTSNKIVVATNNKAVMSEVSFEDDYDSPSLDLKDKSTKMILNVTFNKKYDGDLYIVKEKESTFTGSGTNLQAKYDLSNITKKVDRASELTNKKATLAGAGDGYYYQDKDGKTTYKLVVPVAGGYLPGGLERGAKYYLVFDQAGIEEDNLGAKATKDTLNASAMATVPYVTAPASIKVTTYSNIAPLDQLPEITPYDANGKELTWWNRAKAGSIPDGLDSIKMFGTDSTEVSDSDTGVEPAQVEVKDGVIKLGYGTGFTAGYAYAKIRTTKGVFAEKSAELTSPVAESARTALAGISIAENEKNPADADVTLKGLSSKAPGTVLIMQGDSTKNTAVNTIATKPAADAVGMAHVNGGTSKVTIEGVFSSANMTAAAVSRHENEFIAMFVPDDSELWSPKADGDGEGNVFELKPTVTSFDMTNVTVKTQAGSQTGAAIVVGGIQVLDQFGDKWADRSAIPADITQAKYTISVSANNTTATRVEGIADDAVHTFTVDKSTGILTFTIDDVKDDGIDKGDGFKATITGLAKFEATVTAKGAITITSTNIQKDAETALPIATSTAQGKTLFSVK